MLGSRPQRIVGRKIDIRDHNLACSGLNLLDNGAGILGSKPAARYKNSTEQAGRGCVKCFTIHLGPVGIRVLPGPMGYVWLENLVMHVVRQSPLGRAAFLRNEE